MKLKNILSKFSTTNSEALSDYVQNARFNNELKSMSKEVTYEDLKSHLDDIFKNDKRYKLFNRKKELAKKYVIEIPHEEIFNWWNKDAYFYFNYKKGTYIGIIPANEKEKVVFNSHFFIFQKGQVAYSNHITYLNELNDIDIQINFFKNNIDYIDNIKYPKFEDIKLNYNWALSYDFDRSFDCIKKGHCKIKSCMNNNTCKKYYQVFKFFENLYKCNILFNSLIEYICKATDSQVYIEEDYENCKIWYYIHNLAFLVQLPHFEKNKVIPSCIDIFDLKHAVHIDYIKRIENIDNIKKAKIDLIANDDLFEKYFITSNYLVNNFQYVINDMDKSFDILKNKELLKIDKNNK